MKISCFSWRVNVSLCRYVEEIDYDLGWLFGGDSHEIDYDLEGLFGDIEFNGELVEHLIEEKKKNKLYSIFLREPSMKLHIKESCPPKKRQPLK